MSGFSSLWFETSLFAISTFVLCVVWLRLVLLKPWYQSANKWLLGWLLVIWTAHLMLYLMHIGLVHEFPWLWRLPRPLYYLIFPFAYLYVRQTLRSGVKLSPWHALHALPALIHFIEFLPFYLESNEVKSAILNEAMGNPLLSFAHSEGWLRDYQHNVIRGILGLAYTVAMYMELHRFAQKEIAKSGSGTTALKWLRFFVLMQFVFAMSFVTFLGFKGLASAATRALLVELIATAAHVATALAILINPHYLVSLPRQLKMPSAGPSVLEPTEMDDVQSPSQEPEEVPNTTDHRRKLLQKIDEAMHRDKLYLNHGLTSKELAEKLSIQTHQLSFLINHGLQMRVNDYINKFRIQHIQNELKKNEGDRYTLEALAKDAGFNSRITFIRAVKKQTGEVPSVYFHDLLKNGAQLGEVVEVLK